MSAVREAYKIIFNKQPENMTRWEIAEKVTNAFNVPKLGEELSKEVIFEIVNHIQFPNPEVTREIVGKAEGIATELFDELKGKDEPHMAEIEFLEREYWQKKREFKLR